MESKGKGRNDPQDPATESDDEYGFPDEFPLEATQHYAYWASATHFAHGAQLPASKASYGSGFMVGYEQGSRLKGLGQWRLAGFSALNKAIEDSEKYRKRLETAPNPETLVRFWWVVGYADGFGFGYNGHSGGVLAHSRDPATHGLPQPNRKSPAGVVRAGYAAAVLVGIIAVFSLFNGQNGAAAFGGLTAIFLFWWVRRR